MNREKRFKISIGLNAALFLMEVYAIYLSVKGHMGLSHMIIFYTEDSNILACVTSLFYVISSVKQLKKGTFEPETPAAILRYMATCCLTLTFLVVITILAPTMGPMGFTFMMMRGSVLYMHNLCPILSLISFVFFEKPALEKKHTLWAMVPTFLYAAVSIVLNILRIWHGPYIFLYVYEQPVWMSCIWFVLIVGGAYAIGIGLRALAKGRKNR